MKNDELKTGAPVPVAFYDVGFHLEVNRRHAEAQRPEPPIVFNPEYFEVKQLDGAVYIIGPSKKLVDAGRRLLKGRCACG